MFISWARWDAIPIAALILALSAAVGARASLPQSASSSSEGQAASASSVLDGVFTARQASSGARTFQQACSSCHTASEFSGGKFITRWEGLTVGELFDVVVTTMPEGNPGSLKPEEYAALVAHFLKLNDYPVGKEPLPAEASVLRNIVIKKPGAE